MTIDDRISWVQWHIRTIEGLAVRDDASEVDLDFYQSEIKMFRGVLDDLLAVRLWSIAHNGTFEILRNSEN